MAMAKQEKAEKLSLVLTLFKGENFVCNKSHGFRCRLEAKCCDQVLSSGDFQISSTNSEPQFNFQLAWQFTRRQLKELRSNKIPVKVRCLLVSEDNRSPTELGYSILHVKDAFPWSGGDVEASKARSYPLLGTKERWKDIHPKLLMQLHIEDYSVENALANHNVQSKVINEVSSDSPQNKTKASESRFQNIDEVDKTPRVDVIPETMNSTEKFIWRITEQDGCFQLGRPLEGDDLYVFNTTIVSVSNLHLLWNGRSPKKPAATDDFVWQIRYKAYGCEIKSDPFVLSEGDPTRRTFIGDKATARIRAGGPYFYDYLQETALEFHVVRFQLSPSQDLTDEEVMGMGFADLKDLTQPDVTELRATLDVVSEWGYPNSMIPSEKPEIRVVFQLDATPEFFRKPKTAELEEPPSTPTPIRKDTNSNEQQPRPDDTIDQFLKEMNQMEQAQSQNQGEATTGKGGKHHHRVLENSKSDQSDLSPPPGPNSRSKHYSEEDVRDFLNSKRMKTGMPATQPNVKVPPHHSDNQQSDTDSDESQSPISKISDHYNQSAGDTSEGFSFPKRSQEKSDTLDSSSSSSESSKENSQVEVPEPGTYKITITLARCWIKSKAPFGFEDGIVLSYVHPRFKIEEPVICTATLSNEKHHRGKLDYKCFDIENGVHTVEIFLDGISEKIINGSLDVEFRMKRKDMLEPMFAFSMIPIGRVLVQPGTRGRRVIQGSTDILKTDTNLRIGILKYHTDFVSTTRYRSPKSKDGTKLKDSNKLNISPLKNSGKRVEDNVYVPADIVFQTTDDLRLWQAEKKMEFHRELKEKERAYLKILSEEAAARDTQRDKLMTEKLAGLTKKEKELRKLSSGLADREEQVKKRELELMEMNQRLNLDNNASLESAKLSIRKMQEEHKIEISSLRRRNQEYEAELQKCKGKLVILEVKLEEKEDYINKLKTERHERPDAKLSEKLKLAEQENKLLKKQIIEVERSREQYKKQSETLCIKLGKLQEDRDRQLKEENENLRIQILADKQHKEMKKGRQEGVEALQQIRTIQESKSPRSATATGNSPGARGGKPEKVGDKEQRNRPLSAKVRKEIPVSSEDEIQRLTTMRSGLLNTGAYTKYDMVIKEMERRIVGLAEGKIGK